MFTRSPPEKFWSFVDHSIHNARHNISHRTSHGEQWHPVCQEAGLSKELRKWWVGRRHHGLHTA